MTCALSPKWRWFSRHSWPNSGSKFLVCAAFAFRRGGPAGVNMLYVSFWMRDTLLGSNLRPL
eukprot:1521442-Pyramimonas_sp.AAC.1